MKHGSLFAGIGGFDLGFERAWMQRRLGKWRELYGPAKGKPMGDRTVAFTTGLFFGVIVGIILLATILHLVGA